MEGAPPTYQEPEGVDFIDTPEGQAFLQSDVMPPELVKPPHMKDEEWEGLSDDEKRRIVQYENARARSMQGNASFSNTFGASTQ